MRSSTISLLYLLVVGIIILLTGCQPVHKTNLTVSAGAGLTDALSEINELFMQSNSNILINSNFAAAGDLQRQIENGAPVDIFFSAALKQMDALEKQGLILTDTRRNVLKNKLVLITHCDNQPGISSFTDLLDINVNLIAMGDPEFVPAGDYGRQTLDFLSIPYEELKPKIIFGNNVRQVLHYVENQQVDYGMVYFSDTINADRIRVVAIAPPAINELIVFPVAVIASSRHMEEAITYIDFLFSPAAINIFEKHGFTVIVE